MNSPIVSRNFRQVTFAAVTMGALAMLRAFLVLYPSRHTRLTGSPLLIGFEMVKAAALLLILGRVYIQNNKQDDQAARGNNVYEFGRAASLSVLIDISISLFMQ
jgi:hypothetical protein